jgi:hypothetical protein
MFEGKSTKLLIAAAAMAMLVQSQAAVAGEVTMEVTRTTSTESPASTTQSTTTTTTSTTGTPTIVAPAGGGTVVVSSGASVPLTIVQEQPILQTVDQRRADLDRRIAEALASGKLSEKKAKEFRRELERINGEVVVLRGQPTPSVLRTVVLAQDLDAVALGLHSDVATVTLVPIIEGSHFTVFNGQIVQLDDLAVRRIELENKILSAQAAGRITWEQSNDMRNQLNSIAAMEEVYRNSNGGTITFKDSRAIYRDMDKVANELDKAAH